MLFNVMKKYILTSLALTNHKHSESYTYVYSLVECANYTHINSNHAHHI